MLLVGTKDAFDLQTGQPVYLPGTHLSKACYMCAAPMLLCMLGEKKLLRILVQVTSAASFDAPSKIVGVWGHFA